MQFSAEDLNQIRDLQIRYNSMGLELVHLTLSRQKVQMELESLNEVEQELQKEIFKIRQAERDLAKVLSDKYGVGQLDFSTGNFTPKVD